jgi:hypothetical protein
MVRVMGGNCEDFPSPIMCVGGRGGGGRGGGGGGGGQFLKGGFIDF